MLTAKQESFAQAIAQGFNQTDAYRKAYCAGKMKPETLWSRASDVSKNSKVSARIEELRQPAADMASLTLGSHLQQLELLRDRALEAGHTSAAIRAEELRGKVVGLYTQKIEDPRSHEKMLILLD